MHQKLIKSCRACLLCLLFAFSSQTIAQEQGEVTIPSSAEDSLQETRLDELARLLEKKVDERDALRQSLEGADEPTRAKQQGALNNLNQDITRLTSIFEIVALGNTDTSFLDAPEESETDWREDLVDILDPLLESLKSLTERPRRLAELRETIDTGEIQLDVAGRALAELQSIDPESLDTAAESRIAELVIKWQDEQEQIEQELLVSRSQLERMTKEQKSFFEGIWPATRVFLLGRGLTLIIALVAAVGTWGLMRLLWWAYTTHFTTREQRRTTTWFRLLSYSYYLLTTLVIFLVVLVVLYVREDLLLLALALLLVVGAVLSFRQFLPRYIREARLLLNLGSVREDERIVYNGLPWQVMSLNLHSVLRNPALDGVIRLPLDTMSTLVSRPVKNNLWFPSNRGDYVILPDEVLGQVRHQTPDLVEISVRGGMSMTYSTAEFYTINLINLSRDKTFGVSVTFGFDYALQAISLSEIPKALEDEVRRVIESEGYTNNLTSLLVELATANSSSLDFLIFATFDSKVAGDYYKLQRLLQQSCVAVSNEKGWTIPFPQLTIHRAAP